MEYQYKVCSQKILGVCVATKIQKDVYDLRDAAIRKQLIDMGFGGIVINKGGP